MQNVLEIGHLGPRGMNWRSHVDGCRPVSQLHEHCSNHSSKSVLHDPKSVVLPCGRTRGPACVTPAVVTVGPVCWQLLCSWALLQTNRSVAGTSAQRKCMLVATPVQTSPILKSAILLRSTHHSHMDHTVAQFSALTMSDNTHGKEPVHSNQLDWH